MLLGDLAGKVNGVPLLQQGGSKPFKVTSIDKARGLLGS